MTNEELLTEVAESLRFVSDLFVFDGEAKFYLAQAKLLLEEAGYKATRTNEGVNDLHQQKDKAMSLSGNILTNPHIRERYLAHMGELHQIFKDAQ